MADNALSNDTMVTHMNELLAHFGRDAGWVRCVLHIMNLVANNLLKLFDAPKKGCQSSPARIEDEGVELDTNDTSGGEQNIRGNENDNVEGWVDKTRLLMDAECAVLEEQAQPL